MQSISSKCMQPTWLASDQLPNIQTTSHVRPGLCQSPVSKIYFFVFGHNRDETLCLRNHVSHVTNYCNIISVFLSLNDKGPAYDLTHCEVRDHSVVVEWQKPIYTGSGPITGYHVEYAKEGTSDWTTANEAPVSHCFLKVKCN